MNEEFAENVQTIIGPTLSKLGFVFDFIDNNVDEGGRRIVVVFYKSVDCKMQVYWSAREGEINCMIAPLCAPDEYGLVGGSGLWHYLNGFTKQPDLPLEELVESLRNERAYFTDETRWLEWLKNRIGQHFDTAHAGILAMYA